MALSAFMLPFSFRTKMKSKPTEARRTRAGFSVSIGRGGPQGQVVTVLWGGCPSLSALGTEALQSSITKTLRPEVPSDPDIPMAAWSVRDAQTLLSPFKTSDSQATKLLEHRCHQPVWEPRAACWLVSQVRLGNQIRSQLCHSQLSHLDKLVPILRPHFLSVMRITSNPRAVMSPWDDVATHLAQFLTNSRCPVNGTLSTLFCRRSYVVGQTWEVC